jgi:hypothetical protein
MISIAPVRRRVVRAPRAVVGVAGDAVRRGVGSSTSPRARRARANGAFSAWALGEHRSDPASMREARSELARRLRAVAPRGSRTWYNAHTGVVGWWSLQGVPRRVAAVVDKALDAGRLDLAEEGLELLERTRPRDAEVLRLRGTLYALRGNWAGAKDSWTRSERRRPDGRPGDVWHRVNEEKARAEVRRLLRTVPADLPALAPGSGTRVLADRAVRLAPVVSRPWGFDRAVEAFLAEACATGTTAGLQPLIRAYAAVGSKDVTLAKSELARDIEWIDVAGFAELVRGKRVALVANSPTLLTAELGETIDAYDVVVRFNSFVVDAVHTGVRTDVHVAFHKYEFNLDVPVDVRILVSGDLTLWRESLKLRLQPGRQRLVGDMSLRWPARNLGLVGPDDPFKMPTAGFNMIRLLLHLDTAAAVDLVGFDFYESGMLRVEGARTVPHSPGHDSAAEQAWVLQHARTVGSHIIAMKQGDDA